METTCDVQPLVAELLTAAASLPPPPSDMDLETAEIPGPESDRPSDIIMSRPRFTSIPTSNWSSSVTSISRISSGGILNELSTTTENLSTLKIKSDFSEDQTVASDVEHNETEGHLLSVTNLRHLSQGCLEEYTSEARKLGVRVAESKRVLENTVAQRLHAEQRLFEARIECSEPFVATSLKPQNDLSTELIVQSQSPNNMSTSINPTPSITAGKIGDLGVSVFKDESKLAVYYYILDKLAILVLSCLPTS
ncbi:unnamed protein product [Schistosoma curassoni]|uniref:Uncharacterized protein n=1 Tax=Schistosoma curassoni TaxID=6186 RepID=A0A183JJ94_9TREM|nr:unnamed protein product [Schistosoma curassoni]